MEIPMTPSTPTVSRNSPTREIIEQIIAIHHRALGVHLHKLDALFQQIETLGSDHALCRRATHLFDRLKDQVCRCMVHEKCVVLPQIERWSADGGEYPSSPPPHGLVEIASGLLRWHARLFSQSCRLVRRVRDLEQECAESPLLSALQSALDRFCDDLDQQLFEEDCLLLPRITNWHADSNPAERQLCPR